MSRSISSYFSAVYSWNVRRSQKLKKIKIPYFGGSRSFEVIIVHTIEKLVTSACYNKQYISAYLQLFLH